MKVLLRSACFRIFVLFYLTASIAQARTPTAGVYESSTAAPLIDLLDSAQSRIDIEIYTMKDPIVQKAILNALADHVKVRIVQEPTPVGSACHVFEDAQQADDADCAKLKEFRAKVLKAGGTYVPFSKHLCGGATSGCVEHGKMVIVDAKAAMLSTGNFDSTNLCNRSQKPLRCNRDYDYITRHAPAIQILGQIFERDLAGKPYDLKALLARPGANDLTVSPFSLEPLVAFIRSAKSSIRIQEQYLKDPAMNDEILAAAKRGVDVSINVASACSFGKPTDLDAQKWSATYGAFEKAGAKIRVFTSSMKVGGVKGYLHAKAIVVDDKTGWVGSVNGSTQSVGSNREFGIFFDAPKDVDYLVRFMTGDFKNPSGESWRDSLLCKKD